MGVQRGGHQIGDRQLLAQVADEGCGAAVEAGAGQRRDLGSRGGLRRCRPSSRRRRRARTAAQSARPTPRAAPVTIADLPASSFPITRPIPRLRKATLAKPRRRRRAVSAARHAELRLEITAAARHRSRMDAQFDYIVVGAGTAGCLLANRLSADQSKRVLLLEAGGSDFYPWIHIPVGYLYCIGNPRTDWLYRTEPDPGLNGRVLRYPRGQVMGGCSSINGMIYMRGQARDYDGWAEADRRARPGRGRSRSRISRAREPLAAGLPAPSRSSPGCTAAGASCGSRSSGCRWDILEAFAAACGGGRRSGARRLQRRRQRGGRLFRGDPEGRLAVERGAGLPRARGGGAAEPRDPNRRRGRTAGARAPPGRRPRLSRRRSCAAGATELVARRAVVLSAGAINSPKLLQLSGVGPAALLRGHGMPVVADLPGGGRRTCRTTCRSAASTR